MRGRRLVIILGAVGVVLVLFVASLAIRAVPQPIIEIKGETIGEITIVPGASSILGTLPIRNTLIAQWLVVASLIIIAWFSGRNLKNIPSGWQSFVEAVVEGIRGIVVNAAGEKNGKRFFWVIATFLIFVAVTNWFALMPFFNVVGKVEELTPHHFHKDAVVVRDTGGINLVPFGSKLVKIEVDESACGDLSGGEEDACTEGARAAAIAEAREKKGLGDNEKLAVIAPYFRSANTDLMSTLSLAIISAIFVEFWGLSTLGVFSYGRKFFNFPALRRGPMGVIDFGVGLLEFVAELVRLLSFSFRLFGNMLAGEILLLVMTFLLPFAFFVVGIFYGLEIFVGAIQAFIFGMLTLVFATMAVSGHGDHEEEAQH